MSQSKVMHRGPTIKNLNDDALKQLIIYRITIDGGNLFDFKLNDSPLSPVMRRCMFDFVPQPDEKPANWMHSVLDSLEFVQPYDLGELDGFSVNLGKTMRAQLLRLVNEWTDIKKFSCNCTEEDKHIAEIRPMQTMEVTYSSAFIKIEPILQNSSMAVSALLPDVVESIWDGPVDDAYFITNMTARNGVSDDFGYNGVYLPKLESEEATDDVVNVID